ncbi:MAG: DNA repair protein RadA, partial [uncultured Chloroflexia bacterium]
MTKRTGSSPAVVQGTARATPITEVATGGFERLPVEGEEFSRVLGGGLVPGSLVLMGGDPGIGKSTLLLAAGAKFAMQTGTVLYISAEESPQQLRLRAERLGMLSPQFYVLGETNLDAAINAILDMKPALVVVDSVQTVYLEEITSAAGSVSQVREVALRLLRVAKETGIPI